MVDLSSIKDPSDIRGLTLEECEELADDIREKIIKTVARNGGHLASNLGAVELTIALHRVFSTPEDKLIFDVGHQTYAHKLLTGRCAAFDTLRAYGGISGFPRREESPYDCFDAGHASTAISAALGMARARDALGQHYHVVAVVGDGALTGGMCYEALDDCGNSKTRLIVILNDNEMSISRNVGALSKYLSSLRASAGWNSTKRRVRINLNRIPFIGRPLYRFIHVFKRMLKSAFVNEGFFSSLGFHYLGPIDGNDIGALENIIRKAKELDEPVIIHCMTKKGCGYGRAENLPEEYHGTSPFQVRDGQARPTGEFNGEIANKELIALAEKDKRVVVVTAAMMMGTGTRLFDERFPARFFDVGIAEEHAVTHCAGLACGGMRPFFFVYSTFLQRGYDQVLHDVCIQNLPVVFMLDRAGLANEDGQTHQGLYDIAYLRHIPNMTLMAPADSGELTLMIRAALTLGTPCALRYPKVFEPLPGGLHTEHFTIGHWASLRSGGDAVLLAVGSMAASALRVADALQARGFSIEVVSASTVKPLDGDCLNRVLSRDKPVFTLEEHMLSGGFGSAVLEYAAEHGLHPNVTLLAVGDRFVQHGSHASLLRDVGLDDESLERAMLIKLEGTVAGNVR